MIRLGVTGNIACGKSLVGSFLESLNCPCLDSDALVHELLSERNEATEALIALASPHQIINDDGEYFINRQKLGKILFSDAEFRAKAEKIIHPYCAEKTEKFFQDCEHKGLLVAANLIPLLFEKNLQNRYSYIWLIYCQPNIQRKRLLLRNAHLSIEEAENRIKSQMDQELKKELADCIIDNSGSIENTQMQVKLAMENLLKS